LIGGALLLGRTLGGGWRTPVSLLTLLVFMPAYHTLQVGQVNAFVFAALAVALWGLVRHRDWALGIGVAVGAALKITPLALLVYLLWQQRWRAALAADPGAQPTQIPPDLADLLNDALPPTWSSFSVAAPQAAVADTLDAAEVVDRLIATLPAATPVATIMAERPALLDRSIHRLEHIRTIERARQGRPR